MSDRTFTELDIEVRAMAAANAIADDFAPGFFDDRMVEDTAATIKKHMMADREALIPIKPRRRVEFRDPRTGEVLGTTELGAPVALTPPGRNFFRRLFR